MFPLAELVPFLEATSNEILAPHLDGTDGTVPRPQQEEPISRNRYRHARPLADASGRAQTYMHYLYVLGPRMSDQQSPDSGTN